MKSHYESQVFNKSFKFNQEDKHTHITFHIDVASLVF